MLEKGWNPTLPADTLRKDLIDIHPTASRCKIMLDKVKYHSKLRPFVIVSLHETNSVQVEFSGKLENKHPTFPLSFIKPYQPSDKELFPLRNPASLTVLPVEQSEDKNIKIIFQERRLRGKKQREYLVRYRNPVHEDKWLGESDIP
ncbi:hypothetical protein O181_068815 [Austropuccinia psidii MF-1]|uniref:Chromo domain-containing protein n=1 Tax=Austropuccinia psidii MF-1 TaxID=1389203 RepID=A0A9Q3F1Q9_9BASI|nr:hypothetical protein [Austropuccinia psidii MF-1]